MSPYAAFGVALAFVAAYGVGRLDGSRLERSEQDRAALAVEAAAREGREATAKAISSIRVQNTTIQQRLEREVRREPVYSDPGCRLTPGGLRDLNEALTGTGAIAGGGGVPASDATR